MKNWPLIAIAILIIFLSTIGYYTIKSNKGEQPISDSEVAAIEVSYCYTEDDEEDK